MTAVFLIIRLLLAVVFLVAGLAKASKMDDARSMLEGFGVPAALSPVGARVLPAAELTVAMLLLFSATAWWGAIAAFGLLAVFSIAILGNLIRGKHPPCNCFGQLHSRPIGATTLIRNVLLLIAAGVLVFGGSSASTASLLDVLEYATADWWFLILAGAIVVQGWLIFHLMRQQGRLLLKIDNLELRLDLAGVAQPETTYESYAGLPTGTEAPAFRARRLDCGTSTLAELLDAGKPVLLVFSDPQCGPCNAILPVIVTWRAEPEAAVRVVVISRGTLPDNADKFGNLGLNDVLIQEDREIAELYRMLATPSAVLVDANGVISTPAAVGSEAIEELVTSQGSNITRDNRPDVASSPSQVLQP